jgi:hypothetical protein
LRGSRKAPPTNAIQPGQVLNPGGRPKDDPEFIEACREKTLKALATLERAMDGVENNPGPAVKAAEVILNRGWGSAPQTIKLDANVKAEVSHDVKAELVQSVDRMRTIALVLQKAGALLEGTATADPVEAKTETEIAP